MFATDAAQPRRSGHPRQALRRRIVDLRQSRAELNTPVGDGLRPLLRREGQSAVDRCQQRLVEAICLRHRQRPVRVHADTTHGFGRRAAGYGVVQYGGGRVDVGPGPLLAVEGVLLDGRILRRQDAGERARAAAHGLTRRAEVDEDRDAVVPDDDVRRLDVPMEKALGMNGAQAAQQSLGQPAHLIGLQAAVRCAQQLRHAAAVLELHDRVGGAVGFEIAQHWDDMSMPEPRKGPRLVEKAFATPDEIVGEARPARADLAIGPAHGELDRKVLLDGNELGELGVKGAISDTEPAMPDDCIEPIIAEPRTERQGLIVFG